MAITIPLINLDNIQTLEQLRYLQDVGRLPNVMLPDFSHASTESDVDEDLIFDKFGLYQGRS